MRQGRSQRDVMNYMPPKGPTNINDPKSPSLHGDNQSGREYCGLQGEDAIEAQSSGKPGLGGDNCGVCGTQGRH